MGFVLLGASSLRRPHRSFEPPIPTDSRRLAMSRRRRHPQPTMLFPTADEVDACNHWCAGLHQVERAIAGQQFAEFFRIEDFMMMGMVRSPGQPDIYLHKHALTR